MTMTLRLSLLALNAALAWPACAQTAPTFPLPTPAMQAEIDKDVARHFGDAPLDAGPLASDLSPDLTPAAIDKALRRVADWQLARAQPYFSRIWTESVMYTGFMAASRCWRWHATTTSRSVTACRTRTTSPSPRPISTCISRKRTRAC
jgi:hypothetical protein